MRKWRAELRADMVRMLGTCSLVVCVSEGVAAGLRRAFGYRGPLVVLENGCDFGFWSQAGAPRPARPRTAVYQGGMNERLDVPLIVEVMRALPDWEFRFCGALSPSFADMPRLLAEPNFRYLGMLSPEQLREELHAATAGIIPYVDDPIITERSLPLKAFEYAACGIPVVTVPIAALARLPRVFTFARTAKDFARALTRSAEERGDPELIAERRAAAAAQDYDRRFEELRGLLAEAKVASAPGVSAAAAWRLAWYRGCARWWAFRSWLEAKRQGLVARGILR
jgi:glycosyltransferase involved in cell wall biosynthesis